MINRSTRPIKPSTLSPLLHNPAHPTGVHRRAGAVDETYLGSKIPRYAAYGGGWTGDGGAGERRGRSGSPHRQRTYGRNRTDFLVRNAKRQALSMEATDKMSHMKNPVPMVERLAYVVKEYEESHAGWAAQVVNGRSVDDAGNEMPLVKTECECQ